MKRYIKADETYEVMLKQYPPTKYEYTVLDTYNSLEDAKHAKYKYRHDPKYHLCDIGICEENGKYVLYLIDLKNAKLTDSNEQEQYQHIVKVILSDMGFDTSSWNCTELHKKMGDWILTWDTPVGEMVTSLYIYREEPQIEINLSKSIKIVCNEGSMKKTTGKDRSYSHYSNDYYSNESYISTLDSGKYRTTDKFIIKPLP